MYTLTKLDIKALKHSTSICFDWNDNTSQIRANRDAAHSETGFDQTHFIPCDVEFEIYSEKPGMLYSHVTEKPRHCFGWVSSPEFDYAWMTILESLRENDSIRLKWVSCGNNYLYGATTTVKDDNGGYIAQGEKLYHDRLDVVVLRANGKKSLYHLEDSTCPDNSARMIKMR
jgi:hypothetical protein